MTSGGGRAVTKVRMSDSIDPTLQQPPDLDSRQQALQQGLAERILVLDGATGTALQAANLTAEDFGHPEWDGCNEALCETRPDVVLAVHRGYLSAGADIVETNSFGSTPLVLAEFDAAEKSFEWSRLSAFLARQAVAEIDSQRTAFVCGSMGPTTKALSVTGGIAYEELVEHFRTQAQGLMAGGADYLLLETCQDGLNIKAGVEGIEAAFANAGWRLPVAVSATIETSGTMLGGQDAEALAVSLAHLDLLYVGLNCATGPDLMADSLRTLAELARCPIACVPNAGLPDEDGRYLQGPEEFVAVFSRFLDEGWVNLVGGCCGTEAGHVTALAEMVKGQEPRTPAEYSRRLVAGIEAVELTADNRPLLVGERTNVLGSRKFRRLIESDDFESAAEVGRAQVRGGAQVLDVCLQDPDRDEVIEMTRFLGILTRKVREPLMIDSTDPQVMEVGLKLCQGKPVLNSVNLEDGEERFSNVISLARRYGAAVVVGLIDEQGMAVDVERKIAVAQRSAKLLDGLGLGLEDVWWDALVFPCGTGDPDYVGSAAATLETVTRLHEEFPTSSTVLGVSNISFGLPPAGREVLNSVFLHHATAAGLDAAIVNTERLARYAEIAETDRGLCERLLVLQAGEVEQAEAAVEAFTTHFRQREPQQARPRAEVPLDQRLANAVIEGSREHLIEDLDLALSDERWPGPLAIINGPLMAGMDEVGRRFNANELIVAEVLQSAEVMKAAVDYLEGFMDKAETTSRGKVLLATVKGDVHDIGKNLVDIVLSNNGFEVINLGIKVPSERLIQAVREHEPDLVGLSGLLVKSAHQMVTTATDLTAAAVELPLVVGGAALSRRFTHTRIASEYNGLCTYAKDAMHGLDLVRRILDPETRAGVENEVADLLERDRAQAGSTPTGAAEGSGSHSNLVDQDIVAPAPPDLELHRESFDPDEVWRWLNWQMLLGKHLGLRGSVKRLAESEDAKYQVVVQAVEQAQAHWREKAFAVRGAWRFVPVERHGKRLVVESGGDDDGWAFPRQQGGERLSLVDYVLDDDHLGLFAVTVDHRVRDLSLELKDAGAYLASHTLAALALETAEAAAELLHRRLRRAWGFADPESTGVKDVLKARYRGRRYSFGYPACPDLTGQRLLLELLDSESIGLQLTDGYMMDPEASVSALVFHHPQAKYFSAGDEQE